MFTSEECCSVWCFQNLSKDRGKFSWWRVVKQRDETWGKWNEYDNILDVKNGSPIFVQLWWKNHTPAFVLLSIAYVKAFYNIGDKLFQEHYTEKSMCQVRIKRIFKVGAKRSRKCRFCSGKVLMLWSNYKSKSNISRSSSDVFLEIAVPKM